MDKGFIFFKRNGYLPTNLSNCEKKYINDNSEYGVYLNEDPSIAQCHISAYKCCFESRLEEIYKKQGKPNYYVCPKYPNAAFIVYKKEKKKKLQIRL